MKTRHKSKTVASLLAALLGGLGVHRFYIHGKKDIRGWIYLGATTLYVGVVMAASLQDALAISVIVLFPLPVFMGFIEALFMRVTPDEKWDARYNARSECQLRSGWPLATLLVCTLGGGFIALIASLTRATDLLYTGGSFG